MPLCYNFLMSIHDKIAIITGASRGVGRASALRFAGAGARIFLFSRTRTALEALADEITATGGTAHIVVGDVAREEDVQRLFRQVEEMYGRVDILVNCAGVVAVRPFVEMDAHTWDSILNTNLRGTFLCCREAFRLMAAQRNGVILNISSLSGVKGVEKFPGLSAYNVSKAGVASLTEILAVEGKPYNIRVSVVSPGAIDTEMLHQAAPHLKAAMTADDMADILLFLADDSGRMFNGSNIELFTNA